MAKKEKGQTIDFFYEMKEEEPKKSLKKNEHSEKKAKKKKKEKEQKKEVFDLDSEIVIGMRIPKKKKETKVQKKKDKKNSPKKQVKQHNKEKTVKKPNKKKVVHKKRRTKRQQEAYDKLKKSIQTGCKWGTFFGLLLGSAIYIMLSPLFNITVIEVIGNSKINKEMVINLSDIQIGTNIFQMNKKEIKEKIKQEPYIDTIVIYRKLPNTIIIEVEERSATYMLEFANGYIYLNNQGYLLEIEREKLNVPIIKGCTTSVEEMVPGNRLDIEDLYKLEDILKISEAAKRHEIYELITYFDISDNYNYVLDLEGYHAVHFGEASDINTKVLYLKEINLRERGMVGTIFLNRNPVVFKEAI